MDGAGARESKMAKLIPSLNSVLSRMTSGEEKRFGRRLKPLRWYENC